MQRKHYTLVLLSLGVLGSGAATLAAGPLQQWASGAAGTIGSATTRVPLGAAGSLSAYTESPPQTNGATAHRPNGVAAPIPFAGPETVERWWPAAALTFNPVQQSGNFAKPPSTIASLTSSSNGWNWILGATNTLAEAFSSSGVRIGSRPLGLPCRHGRSGDQYRHRRSPCVWRWFVRGPELLSRLDDQRPRRHLPAQCGDWGRQHAASPPSVEFGPRLVRCGHSQSCSG